MGSPRKGSNTDILLDKVIEGLNKENIEAKKIILREKKIFPCTSCYYCGQKGKCCIKDDMNELYYGFDNSDGIIIASPIYFNTVSSLTKIMIDRCQMFWSSKYLLKNSSIDREKNRIGMFISVGGAPFRTDQFSASTPVVELFFKAINTKYKHNILISGTDENPVWERPDILEKAFEMGKNFFM